MNYPKMIMFDYGHTLLYEPEFNSLRGEEALYKYIIKNERGLSPKDIDDLGNTLAKEILTAKNMNFELHEWQFKSLMYEYLGIEFSIPMSKVEEIFFESTVPCEPMPGTEKMLSYLNDHNIRTAVISNLGFSTEVLTKRIKRNFPENKFEFILTSSRYMFRKPSHWLFELGLNKAKLSPSEVWYCGDNPVADVEGAANCGIFPVWYTNQLECSYRDTANENHPTCELLHIKQWKELIDTLEKIR